MRENKGLRACCKGMSGIEVIVALGILGLVAVVFLGGLSTAFKADIIADERSVAQSLASSQMEYVKSQEYVTAPSGGEATYPKIDLSEYPDYFILGIHRDSSIADDVDGVIGVPWDTDGGTPSTDDNGIQKIAVIIYHPYDSDEPDKTKKVLTLEDYKVDR
jgi:type II secretory pathway pseudopilin PulG